MSIPRDTRKKALSALRGTIQIAENEMTTRGAYIRPNAKPALADTGAVCGGHQACAVGSLFLAGGVPYNIIDTVAARFQRRGFLTKDENAHLSLAYDYLNDAADDYLDEHGIDREDLSSVGAGTAEKLFESSVHRGDEDFTKTNDNARKCLIEVATNAYNNLAAAGA